MIERIKPWLKGIAVAAASMAVFAIALGCFIALMLLVISMEEGGDNLSAYSMSLTAAMALLVQGTGFTAAPVHLTLMPLLLTTLLILLIRAFAQRMTCSVQGYVMGLVVWLIVDALFSGGTNAIFDDALWLILAKGAVVFTVGYLLAAVPVSPVTANIIDRIRQSVSEPIRRTVRIGLTLSAVLLIWYLLIGVIVTGIWIIRNHQAVVRLYELLNMGTGSRILTTIACLAWLPNLCIWAVSWTFGAEFRIGDLATFSLWTGQSTSLPSIPVFGVLPEPVSNDRLRMILVSVPLFCGLIAGLIALLLHRGFNVRVKRSFDADDSRTLIFSLAYPAGAFCIACATMSVASSLVFLLSNGGLGKNHLAHLGVDVMQSTQAVSRPTAIGLLAAWLLTLVGVAAIFGIRWTARRIRKQDPADDVSMGRPAPAAANESDGTRAPRTVSATADVSGNGQDHVSATTKEEQG